jgi:hypothetical protein
VAPGGGVRSGVVLCGATGNGLSWRFGAISGVIPWLCGKSSGATDGGALGSMAGIGGSGCSRSLTVPLVASGLGVKPGWTL